MEIQKDPEIVEKVESTNAFKALHTIMPFSKYLAALLFVILPFLGVWIGYSYAINGLSEKIVLLENQANQICKEDTLNMGFTTQASQIQAIESVSQQDFVLSTENEIDPDWKTYSDEEYGFTFKYSNDFELSNNVLTRTIEGVNDTYESKILIDIEEITNTTSTNDWSNPVMDKVNLFAKEDGYKFDTIQSGTYLLEDLVYFQGTVVNYGVQNLELFVLAKDNYYLILRLEFTTQNQLSDFEKIIQTISFQE